MKMMQKPDAQKETTAVMNLQNVKREVTALVNLLDG